MTTSDIQDQIETLVAEEHRLLEKSDGAGLEKADHQRLQEVKVELDQLWDLLRQRRGRPDDRNGAGCALMTSKQCGVRVYRKRQFGAISSDSVRFKEIRWIVCC